MKKHKCKDCGKTFAQAGSLKTHIAMVHEGIKDHLCEKCSKPFASAGDLKRHIKDVHEKIKSNKCDKCEKYFSRADNLRYSLAKYRQYMYIFSPFFGKYVFDISVFDSNNILFFNNSIQNSHFFLLRQVRVLKFMETTKIYICMCAF